MFERYTEKARRVIFFARYEASQLGSLYIDTEHLLLGLLREDKALAHRFLRSHAAIESIRKQIEAHTKFSQSVSTSVDLPLSHESKRVLSYAADEAERLGHRYIDTSHLLLGLLREEKFFAAQLLSNRGLNLNSVRDEVQQFEISPAKRGSAFIAGVSRWLAEREARGGIWTTAQEHVANSSAHFAIFAGDLSTQNKKGEDRDPTEKLAEILKRINILKGRVEEAIANHEFEKARSFSDEERTEGENLRLLREKFNLEKSPLPVPILCVEIIHNDPLSDLQKRCDDYIAEGVAQVWLLHPNSKRAYTATPIEGFREFKGEILQIANPPLEMDLKKIFE